jgi:putative toxin-antitoxin system antitoxin component (TIGR02293 family)
MRAGFKKTKAPKAKRSAMIVESYLPVSTDKVPGKSGSRILAPAKIVEQVQGGLPVQELEVLRDSLDVPIEKLASKLGISNATLHRRKAQGRLGPAESDRVVRLARLMGKAAKVLGGIEAARQWLNSPQFGLGGAVPLDYAETEIGAREVENLLGRIEYGVYS